MRRIWMSHCTVPTVLLLSALLAGCAAESVTTQPASSPATTSPSRPPAATAASPSPATPYPSQPPSKLHWEPIGNIGYVPPLEVLTSFAGGYVAAAGSGDSTAWFSRDGRNWEERQPLKIVERPCGQSPADYVARDGYVSGGATNGRDVMLVGGASVFTAETCANNTIGLHGKVAWVTSDGRTWSRSELFGPNQAVVSSVWAVPEGWEVALSAWNEPTVIWQSTDGLRWRETAVVGPVNSYGLGAASAGGTRLLGTRRDDQPMLLISDDGRTWREIEAPFVADDSYGFISQIVPPQAARPGMWLVVESRADSTIIWTSLDLLHWEHRAFPAHLPIIDLVATSLGYIASVDALCDTMGGDGGLDGGGECSVPESQYTSADGLNWTMVQPTFVYGTVFVDGPAGVLAVGEGVVWSLEPQPAP